MEIRQFLGPGLMAVGLAGGLAVAQNVVDVRNGQTQPPASTGSSPGGVVSQTSVREKLNLDRVVDGAYVSSLLQLHSHGTREIIVLEAQLLGRDRLPLEVVIEGGNHSNGHTWLIEPGMFDHVSFKIKRKTDPSNPGRVRGTEGLLEATTAALFTSKISHGEWTDRLPASGLLVLTRYPQAPQPPAGKALPREHVPYDLILQPPLPSNVDKGVLVGSLVLTIVATVLAGAIIGASKGSSLRAPINDVSFEFKNSWGTNLAVGGTILNLLTGSTVLSPEKYSSHSTMYLLLAAVFGAFVLLGATLYGLIRPSGSADNGSNVGGYLLSSAVVLWGAFGQLLLLGMLLRELELARVLAPASADLLIAMSKGLALIVIVYAVLTARRITREVPKAGAVLAAPAARAAAVNLPMI